MKTTWLRATSAAMLAGLLMGTTGVALGQEVDAPEKKPAEAKPAEAKPADGEGISEVELSLLRRKLVNDLNAAFEEKPGAVEAMVETFESLMKVSPPDVPTLQLSLNVPLVLEHTGEAQKALDAFGQLKEKYAKSDDAEVKEFIQQRYESASRRLKLVGQPLKLEGQLISGGKFDPTKYEGKIVLVDVWATWCGPCRREFPNIKKNYENYHEQGFEVVGITIDDEAEDAADFVKAEKLPWENIFGGGEGNALVERLGVESIPLTLLIGRDGKVQRLHVRGEALSRELAKLLPAE